MNERDILAQKDFAVKEALVKGRTEGLAEGLAEGEARGEMKGKRETAKNMLAEGLSYDIIYRVTGLSQEEIQCF